MSKHLEDEHYRKERPLYEESRMDSPKKRRSLILKFCPHTNDLLYPKEIPQEKKLIYKCKNCGYEAEIPEESYCVYVNEVCQEERHVERCSMFDCLRCGTVRRNARRFCVMSDRIRHCQGHEMSDALPVNTPRLCTSRRPHQMA